MTNCESTWLGLTHIIIENSPIKEVTSVKHLGVASLYLQQSYSINLQQG